MLSDSYRMNFKNWKVVDIDNFMEGNNFFKIVDEEKLWQEKVEKLLNHKTGDKPKIWNEDKMKSPLFNEEILMPEIKK